MNKLLKISIVGSLVLGFSSTVTAGKEPSLAEKAVEYRQGGFQVMAWNFGAMGAMVKGETPFDAKVFADKADKVSFSSKLMMEGFEVKGSEKGHHTEAKPAVWKEWDKFKEVMDKLQEQTAKLAEIAKTATTVEEVKAQFAETGKVCKNCHEDYKQD